MTLPREVVGAVYDVSDRAFSCRTEDVCIKVCPVQKRAVIDRAYNLAGLKDPTLELFNRRVVPVSGNRPGTPDRAQYRLRDDFGSERTDSAHIDRALKLACGHRKERVAIPRGVNGIDRARHAIVAHLRNLFHLRLVEGKHLSRSRRSWCSWLLDRNASAGPLHHLHEPFALVAHGTRR